MLRQSCWVAFVMEPYLLLIHRRVQESSTNMHTFISVSLCMSPWTPQHPPTRTPSEDLTHPSCRQTLHCSFSSLSQIASDFKRNWQHYIPEVFRKGIWSPLTHTNAENTCVVTCKYTVGWIMTKWDSFRLILNILLGLEVLWCHNIRKCK